MLLEKMRDVPTETRRLRTSDHDFTLNDAVGIELALDTDRFIRQEDQVCRKMQTLLGDVHDFAEHGRVLFRHQPGSRDWHAELSAWDYHPCIRWDLSD